MPCSTSVRPTWSGPLLPAGHPGQPAQSAGDPVLHGVPAAVHRPEGAPGHRPLRGTGRHHPGGQHRLLLDADRRGQPGPSPPDPAPADQRCTAPRGRPVPGGVRYPPGAEWSNRPTR
ncbi:hypothetical protein G6F54_013834 [Rhizopus delemar]|nr:hypothetical protein G6F54_013834 [Rhizopus delemar]